MVVTEVKPASVVLLLPRAIAVVPTVTELFANELFGMFARAKMPVADA